jgi:SAM-dependent methyltransferase
MSKLEEYIERYKGLHDGSDPYYQYDDQTKEWGLKEADPERHTRQEMFSGIQFIRKFPPHIQRYIEQKNKKAVSILDYGSGLGQWTWRSYGDMPRGVLGSMGKHIQSIWFYDPAVEGYDQKPPAEYRFDLVTCADVMEHIPEEFVEQVVNEMAMYCKDDGRLIFAISGNLSYKQFDDGENVHCTVKPIEWWEEIIRATGKEYVIIHADNRRVPIAKTVERVE